jgi:cobalt-zinc-cadmium efflux system protein
MDHSHSQDYNKAFIIGVTLNGLFIIVEFFYGISINSMALIADAGHNLSDVLGLLLAWGAGSLARRSPDNARTYGFRKSTILAALFNSILLLIAVGAITIEAVKKFSDPEPVASMTIIIVAGIGVLINSATALLFISGRKKDLNIRGAFLHMAADAGVSLGVVAAGIAILYTGWNWLDPMISILIVIVITAGTWKLLKESFFLSMDSVPQGINLSDVRDYLRSLDGVKDVHDLHIWGMSTTETALTAHLVIPDERKGDEFLKKVCKELHDKFEIRHATIQIEKNRINATCNPENV